MKKIAFFFLFFVCATATSEIQKEENDTREKSGCDNIGKKQTKCLPPAPPSSPVHKRRIAEGIGTLDQTSLILQQLRKLRQGEHES